jgi:tetratricopeptide (TPR) repeat protein
MDTYFDLGSYSRPIATNSPAAQQWFDRGLNWSYGFNHKEARRCFEKVIALDPDCAMGYWGVAYAIGPYYNQAWTDYSAEWQPKALHKAYTFARKAQKRAATAHPADQALINALAIRFAAPQVDDDSVFAQWDDAYANAMRRAHAQFPDDDDVCALTAEAFICRTRWLLWDLDKGIPAAGSDTAEAVALTEAAFQRAAARGTAPHPGLLHFYIHTLEMSPYPEKALAACDTLLNLVPAAGHLVHMPSHIYILCGLYDQAYDSNAQAMVADQKFVDYDPSLGMYTVYRLHNIHFKIYAALFLGHYSHALQAAEEMVARIPLEGLHHEHDYLVRYLEGYSGMKAHVYVRFGKWEEIKAEPLPADPDLYCVTTAMWHYAKGVAYAATGDIANAEAQQQQFARALLRVPADRRIFENSCRDILAVAEAMLAGELDYRRAAYDLAFAHLREAVARYDRLSYTEPWPWMQPPRHALGALLLEQGQVEEATAVYRADLGLDNTLLRPSQHPNNVWSLHGYVECLERLGRGEETAVYRQKLAEAEKTADFTITASCLCRQTPHCCD